MAQVRGHPDDRQHVAAGEGGVHDDDGIEGRLGEHVHDLPRILGTEDPVGVDHRVGGDGAEALAVLKQLAESGLRVLLALLIEPANGVEDNADARRILWSIRGAVRDGHRVTSQVAG